MVLFISYSHDSEPHRERVLALSERLRDDGYDTRLDRYVNGTPLEGWPRWMLDRLDEANFVLVICTETYYKRFRGHEVQDQGFGVDWEGMLITTEIYDEKSRTIRFVPVLFDPADQRFIPDPLRAATRYTLTSEPDYESLKDFLDQVAGVEPRQLGKRIPRARRSGKPLTFDSSGDSHELTVSRIIGLVREKTSQLFGREGLVRHLKQLLHAGRALVFDVAKDVNLYLRGDSIAAHSSSYAEDSVLTVKQKRLIGIAIWSTALLMLMVPAIAFLVRSNVSPNEKVDSNHSNASLNEEVAKKEAESIAKGMRDLLGHYIASVVEPVMGSANLVASVRNDPDEGWVYPVANGKGIPVPFNYIRSANEHYKFGNGSRHQIEVYSDYPFKKPNAKKEAGDQERSELLKTLTETETEKDEYWNSNYQYGKLQGRFGRYVKLIRMEEGCVACHNATGKNLPFWNGKLWNIGEVRGMIEVIVLIDAPAGQK